MKVLAHSEAILTEHECAIHIEEQHGDFVEQLHDSVGVAASPYFPRSNPATKVNI